MCGSGVIRMPDIVHLDWCVRNVTNVLFQDSLSGSQPQRRSLTRGAIIDRMCGFEIKI